jgi:Holliday junction resolvase
MNSRQKGASGERELANLLKKLGFKTRRGVQFCGANGDADVVGVPGLHIECKRVERLNIHEAMQQSRRDARGDEIPVVMHRKNRTSWLVTLDLMDFVDLWKEADR